MARHILLAGKISARRRCLEADLLAMYDDVVVSEVITVQQAGAALANGNIHLVIYALDSDDEAGINFCADTVSNGKNNLPCLVLATDQKVTDEAGRRGIKNILTMPYSTDKLAEIINRICNPVGLRKSKRYSLPDATAEIMQREMRIKADVLNLSYGGVLCEFKPDYMFRISDPVMINLKLSDGNLPEDHKIYAIPSNMKVLERNADYTLLKIRVGFKFITLSAKVLDCLRIIFNDVDP